MYVARRLRAQSPAKPLELSRLSHFRRVDIDIHGGRATQGVAAIWLSPVTSFDRRQQVEISFEGGSRLRRSFFSHHDVPLAGQSSGRAREPRQKRVRLVY